MKTNLYPKTIALLQNLPEFAPPCNIPRVSEILMGFGPEYTKPNTSNPEISRCYLTMFINLSSLITCLAEDEEAIDSCFLVITLSHGEQIQTEWGFSHMEIQGEELLVEDDPDSGAPIQGDKAYWIIPIKDIRHISLES